MIDFRGRWSEFHLYRVAAKKHCRSPDHLRMKELALPSILLTADDVTSHSFKGHITLGYKVT